MGGWVDKFLLELPKKQCADICALFRSVKERQVGGLCVGVGWAG